MRLKNKGYTLVELLLSIAIFSIVMVGIASIMSSTLKSYSKANIDITVQEDCQMAANQLEELLCDANSISAYDPAVGWAFNDGTAQVISYDGSKVILTKGGVDYTIADHVTSFSLDNWKTDSNVTSATEKAYNQIVINMAMDNNGTTYSLKRNVYFRNDIENNTFHSINNLMGEAGGSGGSGTPGEINLTVKRYEKVNLTADYRIRYNCKLYEKNGGSWDLKTDPNPDTPTTVNNAVFKLEKASDSPTLSSSYPGASTFYLSTGTNVTNSFTATVAGTYKIEGFRDASCTDKVEIILSVDSVQILSTGVCVQQHEGESVNGEGFSTPINVKGINVNEGLKTGDFTLKFKYNVQRSSGKLGNDWTGEKTIGACTDGVINWGNYTSQYDFNPDRIILGIAPDPFTGGLLIVGPNDRLGVTASSLCGKKDVTLHFNVSMTSGTGSATIPDMELKFTGLSTGF